MRKMVNKTTDIHFFKREKKNILYDPRSMVFYRISDSISEEQVENLLAQGSNQLFASEPTASVYYSKNSIKAERLVLTVAQKCNLACRYCYADGGSYGEDKEWLMSEDTALAALKFFHSYFSDGIGTLQFFGGEPLLNIELIESICERVSTDVVRNQSLVSNFAIVTNGTLINDRAIKLFNKYRFIVTISLDGNKEQNDAQRMFRKGTESVHDKVVEMIKQLNKRRLFPLNVEITLSSEHIRGLKEGIVEPYILEYIHALGVDGVHIVPVAVPADHSLSTCSADIDTTKVFELFDSFSKYSLDSLCTENPLLIQKLAVSLGNLFQRKRPANFCGAGIIDFTVNTVGIIYPCFMFIGQSEYIMGDVHSADFSIFTKKRHEIVENTIDKCQKCNGCWAKGLCNNCIGSAYLINKTINYPISDFCEPQKAMLERLMAELASLQSNKEKWAKFRGRFG